MSATAKRQRGLAIHRSILIGNTATPLSEAERLHAPPDHTHKWTVAVRSAASHPLPTISQADQLGIPSEIGTGTPALANGEGDTPNNAAATSSSGGGVAAAAAAAGMSTRGRDSETDYHKMVGGKDDISHFIKRVQFKLHETYPQSQRNVDKPPFQVTETGWGEFDIQIKIYFVPEANEKPLTTFHRLKLHPWHPIAVPASSEIPAADEAQADVSLPGGTTLDGAAEDETHASMDQTEDATTDINEVSEANEVDQSMLDGDNENPTGAEMTVVKTEDVASGAAIVHETRSASAAAAMPAQRNMPAVVHSWSFDEIVFPEPLEPFYDILVANPPTPLPAQSAQAYADPSAFERYKESLQHLNSASGPQGRDINVESAVVRPHPLFDSTGALFDALSREAILAEGERLDKARANAVAELEASRNKLIDCEARLRQGRSRIITTTTVAPSTS